MTRIDRRALFTSGAAAALLTASGLSLEAAPRSGGRLRLAVPRQGAALDLVARRAVFDTLTEIGPEGVLRGELATGGQAGRDARRWVFDLRGEVRFHDGRPFGAQDVLASLAAVDAPELGGILATQALGRHKVQIELALGNPDLPLVLSRPEFAIMPVGAHPDDMIGTGLFGMRRWQSGRQFLGHRVAAHYKDGQAGWLDSFEVVVIPDAAVRSEALRDGFVDVAVLPEAEGLRVGGAFQYHPSQDQMDLAAQPRVGMPRRIGSQATLDDGRIAERWWML